MQRTNFSQINSQIEEIRMPKSEKHIMQNLRHELLVKESILFFRKIRFWKIPDMPMVTNVY